MPRHVISGDCQPHFGKYSFGGWIRFNDRPAWSKRDSGTENYFCFYNHSVHPLEFDHTAHANPGPSPAAVDERRPRKASLFYLICPPSPGPLEPSVAAPLRLSAQHIYIVSRSHSHSAKSRRVCRSEARTFEEGKT